MEDQPAEEIATALISGCAGWRWRRSWDPHAVPAHLASELHALVYAGSAARARAAAQ